MIRKAVAGAFEVASAIRRKKVFHPHGVVHEAAVTVTDALLAPPGEHRAIVRLSRGIGLRRPLPDILGMAIRILDAHGDGRHQDLLLVTSADLPVARFALLPAIDFDGHAYSSVLPYETPEGLRLIGGRLDVGRAQITIASPAGRSRRLATVELGERYSGPEPRFDPANTGPGLRPAGFLNRLREYAYSASQAGWLRHGRRLRT